MSLSGSNLSYVKENFKFLLTGTATFQFRLNYIFQLMSLSFFLSDDFQFFEQSTIKSIEIMNQKKITNMGCLTSKKIDITETEMLKFTQMAFLNSKTILNDVCLPFLNFQ
jgi:hypothetical protein